MTQTDEVLLLGNAGAGKTTLLAQLHGRLQLGDGRLRMRTASSSIASIEAALMRLEQGLPVEHTPRNISVEQMLHAVDSASRSIDVKLPDYAGETLTDVVSRRSLSPAWRARLRSAAHWILLLRLSQYPVIPNILDNPVTVEETEYEDLDDDGHATLGLPLDLWVVELLQILLFGLRSATHERLPKLTVALSCWDELDYAEGRKPAEVLADRAAMAASFCAAHWPIHKLSIVGLSAQGQVLHKDIESNEVIDAGPQRIGWLVTADGSKDTDLTQLLAAK